MKLTFLGTRGEIEPCSRRHNRHSALLVSHRSGRVLIDRGADWLGQFRRFRPNAVVLTSKNLARIGPASDWAALYIIEPRNQVKICGTSFEAFTLELIGHASMRQHLD